MSSFSEGKAEELATSHATDYVKHNQFQLSRIYPSGLRTDSSNYSPFSMWSCGCQIGLRNCIVYDYYAYLLDKKIVFDERKLEDQFIVYLKCLGTI